MQCKILKNQKKRYVQIYLNKEELATQETKEKINEYKKQKYKLGIFVSGKENYPEVLKKIVINQVEISNNAC